MTVSEFKGRVLSIQENESGCKIWKGSKSTNGYGQVTVFGKKMQAHRVSFLAFIGEIPNGFFVCHKCDCPPCVNPEHLWIGTHQENMLDMAQKGRGRTWKPEPPHVPLLKPLGETDAPSAPFRILYLGKLITFQWIPIGGWMATFDGKNILNPYTQSAFRRMRDCVHMTKFCVRHGFYPGLKPSAWRAKHGLSNITL